MKNYLLVCSECSHNLILINSQKIDPVRLEENNATKEDPLATEIIDSTVIENVGKPDYKVFQAENILLKKLVNEMQENNELLKFKINVLNKQLEDFVGCATNVNTIKTNSA